MIDGMSELAKTLVVQMVAQCRTAVPQPIIQTNGWPALVWHNQVYSITQMPPVLEESELKPDSESESESEEEHG